MKVGINLPSQFPWESTAAMLEVYEQVGFDSYWSPDHILGVFHPELWGETPLSALAADPDAFYDPFVYGAKVGTMTDPDSAMSRAVGPSIRLPCSIECTPECTAIAMASGE